MGSSVVSNVVSIVLLLQLLRCGSAAGVLLLLLCMMLSFDGHVIGSSIFVSMALHCSDQAESL